KDIAPVRLQARIVLTSRDALQAAAHPLNGALLAPHQQAEAAADHDQRYSEHQREHAQRCACGGLQLPAVDSALDGADSMRLEANRSLELQVADLAGEQSHGALLALDDGA